MSALRTFGRIVVVVLMIATVLSLAVIIMGMMGGGLGRTFLVWPWIGALCGSFAGLCGLMAVFDIADASEEQANLLRQLVERGRPERAVSSAPSAPSRPRGSNLDRLEGIQLKPR